MKRQTLTVLSIIVIIGLAYVGYKVANDYQHLMKFYAAAEHGDAGAETRMCLFSYKGDPFYHGDGFPQDYAKAMMWCKRAADQGYAQAQFYVGRMYWLGQGVSMDLVQSYMWLLLAAKQNPRVTTQNIPAIEALLTPEQMAEGRRRAAEWKPTTDTKPDNKLQ